MPNPTPSPVRVAAVRAAAMRLCICDSECFETRHGMMNGPCEMQFNTTIAAIAAYARAMGRTDEANMLEMMRGG